MESKLLGLSLAAAALLGVAWLFVSFLPSGAFTTNRAEIVNFEECVAAGNPVMPAHQSLGVGGESYPRQCAANGQTFVEVLPAEQQQGQGIVFNGCAVAGCSRQLCVAAIEADNIMTTCEYRAEYGCYREASCEPQADGQCGWTQTEELTQCLANPPAEETQTNLQVL